VATHVRLGSERTTAEAIEVRLHWMANGWHYGVEGGSHPIFFPTEGLHSISHLHPINFYCDFRKLRDK
jgi:hypothetical protein